eukprot:7561476-Pyramimonas_sp.AAC.1
MIPIGRFGRREMMAGNVRRRTVCANAVGSRAVSDAMSNARARSGACSRPLKTSGGRNTTTTYSLPPSSVSPLPTGAHEYRIHGSLSDGPWRAFL